MSTEYYDLRTVSAITDISLFHATWKTVILGRDMPANCLESNQSGSVKPASHFTSGQEAMSANFPCS